jgi:hypothetical protein
MALSEEVLKKLITPNARALSSPKGDKIISEGPVGRAEDFDDSMFLAETYNEEPSSMSSNGGYLSESAAAKNRALTDYSSNNFNPDRVKNSRISSAILEDMVKHPIDTTALNTQKLESASGNLNENMSRFNKMVAGAKMVDKRANELDGKSPERKIGQGVTGSEFDYAALKEIIYEAIDKKLGDIGTLKAIGLSAGKIKLVDNKGNVFVAKLEYKGNVNDKNKGDD